MTDCQRRSICGWIAGAGLGVGLAGSAGPAMAREPKRQRAASAPAAAVNHMSPLYGQRADVRAFTAEVAERRNLPPEWLAAQLAQARRIETVRKLVMPAPAGTAKNWAAYRARFIEPLRVEAGLNFWRQNERWLQQAEERWGVPAQIVVGVVGVETFYGRVTGNFRILDALSTLAFDFPTGRKDRSPFFRAELEEFFVLCAREGTNPQEARGSYAGAMGMPQFMPGSINRHAVDLDGDGRIDLLGDTSDVVGSVANYLAQAGWLRNQPTHFEVVVPVETTERAVLLAPDILPSFTAAQMAEHGAQLDEAGRAYAGSLALVELQNGDRAPSYVAGTANFYAVTRYNPSSYYAMAVIDLGVAVAARRAGTVR